jgi:hypothetical protein
MPRYPNTPSNMAGRVKEYFHHLANGGDNVSDVLSSMLGHRIISGGILAAPSTPSVQSTGAGGNLAWRCNFSYVYMAGDGDYHELAAGADQVLWNAATPITTAIPYITCAVVIYKKADGTKNFLGSTNLPVGAAATTAALAVGPSDTVIQTKVNTASSETGDTWWKLGEIQLYRSADTTVVATYYNNRGDRGIWLPSW